MFCFHMCWGIINGVLEWLLFIEAVFDLFSNCAPFLDHVFISQYRYTTSPHSSHGLM